MTRLAYLEVLAAQCESQIAVILDFAGSQKICGHYCLFLYFYLKSKSTCVYNRQKTCGNPLPPIATVWFLHVPLPQLPITVTNQ